MPHSYSNAFCRRLPLSVLSSATRLSSFSLDLPSDHLTALEQLHTPMICQLTSLCKLVLRCEVDDMFWENPISVPALSGLTNLQQLVVNGFLPEQQQQQKQQQGFLPVSLTSFTIGTGADLSEEEAMSALKGWLQCAAGCSNLQQLQLVNLTTDVSNLHDVNIGAFTALEEFRVLCTFAIDSFGDPSIGYPCVAKLSNLKVLSVATYNLPDCWSQKFWKSTQQYLLASLSRPCPLLTELGPVMLDDGPIPEPFQKMSRLSVVEGLPAWVDLHHFPILSHLLLDLADPVTSDMLTQLAQLSMLTCLQLDGAFAYNELSQGDGWVKELDVLARGLSHLQRFELINFHVEPICPENPFPPLSMPRLSAFTQLKQLWLACFLGPENPLIEQLTGVDLLRGLSCLTQLEQLELEGYVAVSPAVVCGLIERLPSLLGRCSHPQVQVVHGREEAQALAVGVSDFREVQEMYSQMRPRLSIRVK